MPADSFEAQRQACALPLAVTIDGERYLDGRLHLLEKQLATVERLAGANDLPKAIVTESGLKIAPLDAAVPEAVQALIDQTAALLARELSWLHDGIIRDETYSAALAELVNASRAIPSPHSGMTA